ncbi:MAG: acyltransferase [Muribaculaceae bacterium]|nr:acyltransferase [Muribaculaceae bacterium]
MEYIKQKKERFKNIDFLRFIFSIAIVMFHFQAACNMNTILPGIKQCNVCVDYFFIISGFFLFNNINLKQSTFEFAKRRFLRLAPLVYFFLAVLSFLSLFTNGIHINLTNNILRMLLIHNIGFGPVTGGIGSHIHWFISALFWVTLFYFYLAKIIPKKYLNLIIWLIVVFSYGLHFNFGHFSTGGNTKNIFFVFNIGILRALGGLGIGYFISEIYNMKPVHNVKMGYKIIASVLEIYICGFLGYYMLFSAKLPSKTGFTFIVMFSILFYLFLVRQGVLSRLLNKDFSSVLGSYSYSIYVMHAMVQPLFRAYIHSSYLEIHNAELYIIQIITALILGISVHYLFEKPVNKLLNQTLLVKTGKK